MRPAAHPPRAPVLQACSGAALAALLVLALCGLDLHGLGTLIAEDRAPYVPMLLLMAGLAGTFAAAAFGTGLCMQRGGR